VHEIVVGVPRAVIRVFKALLLQRSEDIVADEGGYHGSSTSTFLQRKTQLIGLEDIFVPERLLLRITRGSPFKMAEPR
jgi:hypothetical protein